MHNSHYNHKHRMKHSAGASGFCGAGTWLLGLVQTCVPRQCSSCATPTYPTSIQPILAMPHSPCASTPCLLFYTPAMRLKNTPTPTYRAFSGHCNLRHLSLCCEHTSDAGLAALSGLSHLQDLTLCEGVAISAQRLVGVIQRLNRLKVSLFVFLYCHGSTTGAVVVGSEEDTY